jgi:hypothetical protein
MALSTQGEVEVEAEGEGEGEAPVVVVRVEVAPLPDGGVGPAAREVGLGLALHAQVVRRQLAPLRHVAHDVEQPVAHAPREVCHLALRALLLAHTARFTTISLHSIRYSHYDKPTRFPIYDGSV